MRDCNGKPPPEAETWSVKPDSRENRSGYGLGEREPRLARTSESGSGDERERGLLEATT